jgi:hypothetical protein
MAATYAAMVAGGGLPTTITGTGFGPTKPDARKKAEQDARSRLNRATNNVRDQLHDSEAPLDDPTNPNRLPVAEYPEFATHNPPDRSKGGGIESAWKALDRVEAHRAAAVDNADTDEERAAASGGNKAWSEVVFTTANSVVGMPGRVRVEKSFEDWRQGNRKSCSPFAWVSRCTLTITWPRRLDVHVFYPRPGAREE